MSVSKYQMFLKTVECGSFSRAAEELNFTQSGVSHAVRRWRTSWESRCSAATAAAWC